MKRLFAAFIATIALTLALALPASAGAKTGEVLWRCDPDGSDQQPEVTFVSAPAEAFHGIDTANKRAGSLAFAMFGEVCRVVRVVVP
jgi:hypothetical protein